MLIPTFDKTITQDYETIYRGSEPRRREEQQLIAIAMASMLKKKRVLELAAGTGYWTSYLAHTAASIMVTDIDPEILAFAKEKTYDCPVTFQIEDAYNLSFSKKSFQGGVANFWLSHIPRSDAPAFLEEFHRVMKKNSRIFMADNVYGDSIDYTAPTNMNKPVLADGQSQTILKNRYTKEELISLFQTYDPTFTSSNIFYGDYFWYLYYQV